jgi:NADH:ubiquinone oxidoreductase subunit 3 (subunit A)
VGRPHDAAALLYVSAAACRSVAALPFTDGYITPKPLGAGPSVPLLAVRFCCVPENACRQLSSLKMFSSEFLILATSCLQPLVIGLVAFSGLGRQIASADLAQSLATVNQKLGAFRFYECASYSRLGSLLRYNVSFFSILIAFIIYDIDFIFLVSEVLMLSGYGAACWFAFSFFILCLVVGLWYDYSSVGYSWYAS